MQSIAPKLQHGGPSGRDPGGGGYGGGGDGNDGFGEFHFWPSIYQVGIVVTLVSVTSFFVALMLMYFFSLKAQITWHRVEIPIQFWVSTGLLAVSSMTLEAARYAGWHGRLRSYALWLDATLGLGIGFLVSQVAGWQTLMAQGIHLQRNPHGSVFYMFTGAHALHVLGGLVWLSILTWRAASLRDGREHALRRHRAVMGAASLYWHFMAVLWLCLFGLLLRWR